jgi:peptidoglycan/LPS O-acetylase OafA/YrhL
MPALDGVRAVAALAVVATHVAYQTGEVTSGPLGELAGRMDSSVAVFFALSGFLLARPSLAGRPSATGIYFRRRAARILPAYWIVLSVVVLTHGASALDAFIHVVLAQAYGGHELGDFTQTWSLSTEVSFYLMLPVLMWWLRSLSSDRNRLWACGWLSLGALVFVGVVSSVSSLPSTVGLWLPAHLDWFLIGVALAVVVTSSDPAPFWVSTQRRLTDLSDYAGTCWLVAAILLLLVTTPVAGPLTLAPIPATAAVFREAVYAVTALLLLAPCVRPGPVGNPLLGLLSHPFARWLGRISYGIFLWHLLVLDAVFSVTETPMFSGRAPWIYLLTILGSIAVSAVSWYVIEQPITAWAHRRRPEPVGPVR